MTRTKMSLLYFMVIVVSYKVTLGNVCHRIKGDFCSCRTPFGDEYSLSPIDNIAVPAFHLNGTSRYFDYFFDYSPCTPMVDTICGGALVCQLHKRLIYSKYNLGKAETFGPKFVDGKLVFHYTGNGRRFARIVLNCQQNATSPKLSQFTETVEAQGYVYTATLTSMYACPIKMNRTCPTTQVKHTTKPFSVATSEVTSCKPCISHDSKLISAIIALLFIQLVSYSAFGYYWYKKNTILNKELQNHKPIKS